MLAQIKSFARHPVQFLKTSASAFCRRSDVERWQDIGNLDEDWDSRTRQIAALVPEGAAVLEFGAGRLVLAEHLPPTSTYQPSDIVDRGRGTIVWDLNRGFPDLPRRYSYTVFSGVLEYVSDLGAVVDGLRCHTDFVIASYSTTDKLSDPITRCRNGWISHLTEKRFLACFEDRGFRLREVHPWRLQTIYVLENA